jgi:hypothetical protein
MVPSLLLVCSNCGRMHGDSASACEVCGSPLSRSHAAEAQEVNPIDRGPTPSAPAEEPKMRAESFRLMARASVDAPPMKSDLRLAPLRRIVPRAPRSIEPQPRYDERFAGMDRRKLESTESNVALIAPWIYLVLGLVCVPVFALVPMLETFGALITSVVHEIGHAAIAFLCGMPAVPQISIAGHPSAVHSNQSMGMVIIIGSSLAGLSLRWFEGRRRWIALGIVCIAYPAIALTPAKELLHLLSGHGAELACATGCMWAALDGGFTKFKLERLLFGSIGWYIVIRNFQLCCSLMRTSEVRDHYAHKPMFVLTNDYVRAAINVLSCPIEHVVLSMLLASLLVMPAAIVLWSSSRAKRAQCG